jgi:hypothetical protein
MYPQQQMMPGMFGQPMMGGVAASSDLSSQKGSKISINSLQKSKDRIQQIKMQQDKMKQHIIASGSQTSNLGSSAMTGNTSGTKAGQRYNNNDSMMNDSEQNELDKLNFNDVSLTKTGEKTTIGSKPAK